MHGVRPQHRRHGPPTTHGRKRKRRISRAAEEEAIKTADYFLGPFIGDVTSWNEYGSDAGNPRRELQHAIALVECALSDKSAADIFQFCYLGPSPFIELARKAAIPILKRARPAAGSKSGPPSLSWRDRLIIEAIKEVCVRHELNPTRNPGSRDEEHDPSCCSVVAEALRRRRIKLGEKRITDEIWPKRTST
jgi:hypothetical protein